MLYPTIATPPFPLLFQGLAWEFSAETISIVFAQIIVAVVSAQEYQVR